jgi:prophage regulatory protein
MSTDDDSIEIVRTKVAKTIIPFSDTERERRVKAGEYPQPVKLGPRMIGFVKSELVAYAKKLIAERDAEIATREKGGAK